MSTLTPREIVQELDKHIIGQDAAKRAVAIALRNRWRRMQVLEPLRQEITPKNILMIGPTGVGKTEIARRLARLANAPFVKIEATKFTEVGYVGRDVDSIVKELADVAVKMTREQEMEKVRQRAAAAAEERVLDALLPKPRVMGFSTDEPAQPRDAETREKFRRMLRAGELDEREIEIELRTVPMGVEIMAPPGMEEMQQQLQSMFQNLGGSRTRSRKLKVREAVKLLVEDEAANLINEDELKIKASVYLRRGDIGMAEQLLYAAQLGAGFEQVRGEGMTEQVRVHVLRQALTARPIQDALLDLSAAEPPAAAPDEQCPLGPGRPGHTLLQPALERLDGLAADGHGALLAAFAEHTHGAVAQIEMLQVEPGELGEA